MKLCTIIGARPQFVKAAVLSRLIALEANIQEVIIHTGQHYDPQMSQIFFNDLKIPEPDYNLEVGSKSHGMQTAEMLWKIEETLLRENPDWVIVYGDTNSTIAASLAASKLNIKVAHIEAGLRSFNRKMPEEINRICTDRISELLFAPTQTAMDHLSNEGLASKSKFSGDVMYDSVLFYKQLLERNSRKYYIDNLPDKFYLATVHRAENTDHPERLSSIFKAFSTMKTPVVLPLHPRTRKHLASLDISNNVIIIEPVGYLHMLSLLNRSVKVLTDSGGLQKEAYFLRKQCITLRDETEWVETLNDNWNTIVGANYKSIMSAVSTETDMANQKQYFGDGNAAIKILETLKGWEK